MKAGTEYKEIQKFSQSWIWIVLGIPGLSIVGMFALGISRQVLNGQKFGNHPMSDQGLVITFVLVLLLLLLIAMLLGFSRLTTQIDEQGIAYRFFPFHRKFRRIGWDLIEEVSVVKYNPVRDYGGWGLRGNRSCKAYNVSGDMGLQIKLKAGRTVLIGTRKEVALRVFLDKNVIDRSNSYR